MSGADIIESPEEGTAGISSACQLVNVTEAVAYISNNTSLAIEEIAVEFPIIKGKEIPILAFKPLKSRAKGFREILMAAIEDNRELLRELAKY